MLDRVGPGQEALAQHGRHRGGGRPTAPTAAQDGRPRAAATETTVSITHT